MTSTMPDTCHQKQVRLTFETQEPSSKISPLGGDYGNTGPNSGRSQNYGLDSDDYDETVGHEVTVDNRVENCDQILFTLTFTLCLLGP